jgi:peptidoglycan/xylan/chitin deacetylase (PgdA/CDA1 family)
MLIRRISVLAAVALILAALIVGAAERPHAATASAREQTASPEATPTPALPKISYGSCHVDGPYVAMTFDDGPSAENTPRLLDMLKERDIKATFFMIGENAARWPEIVKRVAAEGHEIGNHSWSHPLLAKMTDDEVREQLQKTQDAIVQASGYTPGLLRPPYGGFTGRQRRWANAIFGYKIIFWDVDPLDWKIHDSNHVESEILKQTKPGSIILAHDIHKTTVDAMPETLDALLAKGFKFVTVSELIAMDRPAEPKPETEAHQSPSPAGAPSARTTPAPSPPTSS